jgi:Serine carboxypeptidase S28
MRILLCTILFCSLALFGARRVHKNKPQETASLFNQTQYWFNEQKLDHFYAPDNRVWSQRYWVVDQFYNPASGPVFMYICGEYTCPGVMPERLYPVMVAAELQALILVLEHRYFGLSAPFGIYSFSTANMSYLTVQQALADLAFFIQWVQGNNSAVQVNPNSNWISLGGSYPGALSAWFRLKYPNLVVGSWAASPVINDILNFSNFDYQVYLSTVKSGPLCPQIIQNLSNYMESAVFNYGQNYSQQFKSNFGPGATQLSNVEFLWLVTDTIAEAVQYGGRTELCQMLESYSNFDDLVDAVANFVIENNDASDYGAYFLSNDTWTPENDGGRQWTYLVCSQLGWFQGPGPYPEYAMRSSLINMSFYQQWCEQVFGIPIWPDINQINVEFGGRNIQSSNTILTNGCEDPWQWASNTNDTGDVTSYYANCTDCGHCADLYTPTLNDSWNLVQIRINTFNNITSWLSSAETIEL